MIFFVVVRRKYFLWFFKESLDIFASYITYSCLPTLESLIASTRLSKRYGWREMRRLIAATAYKIIGYEFECFHLAKFETHLKISQTFWNEKCCFLLFCFILRKFWLTLWHKIRALRCTKLVEINSRYLTAIRDSRVMSRVTQFSTFFLRLLA